MGFRPRDVDEMTLWQFTACCAAFARDQAGGLPEAAMTDEEARALGIVGF